MDNPGVNIPDTAVPLPDTVRSPVETYRELLRNTLDSYLTQVSNFLLAALRWRKLL